MLFTKGIGYYDEESYKIIVDDEGNIHERKHYPTFSIAGDINDFYINGSKIDNDPIYKEVECTVWIQYEFIEEDDDLYELDYDEICENFLKEALALANDKAKAAFKDK